MLNRSRAVGWFKVHHMLIEEELASLSGASVKVFLALWRHADAAGMAWPSRQRLARLTGISVRSVACALHDLQHRRLLLTAGQRVNRAVCYQLQYAPLDGPAVALPVPSPANGASIPSGASIPNGASISNSASIPNSAENSTGATDVVSTDTTAAADSPVDSAQVQLAAGVLGNNQHDTCEAPCPPSRSIEQHPKNKRERAEAGQNENQPSRLDFVEAMNRLRAFVPPKANTPAGAVASGTRPGPGTGYTPGTGYQPGMGYSPGRAFVPSGKYRPEPPEVRRQRQQAIEQRRLQLQQEAECAARSAQQTQETIAAMSPELLASLKQRVLDKFPPKLAAKFNAKSPFESTTLAAMIVGELQCTLAQPK